MYLTWGLNGKKILTTWLDSAPPANRATVHTTTSHSFPSNKRQALSYLEDFAVFILSNALPGGGKGM